MPDEQSLPPDAPIEGGRTAVRLGTILLVGVALIAIFAMRDRSQVFALERFQQVTAVGDKAYFQVPKPGQQSGTRAATLDGVALYLATDEKVKVDDSQMVRVARDEASGLTIYGKRESIESGRGERVKKEASYFLKIAPGEYLGVRSAKP